MGEMAGTVEGLHRYQQAADTERTAVFKSLLNDRSTQQLKYKKRFIDGANPKRPAYLHFSASALHKENSFFPSTIFHEGLLKDQAGVYWIVKKFNPEAREDRDPREPRNSPRYERLAYSLAEDRANYAEIRRLQGGYYLTRVVTDSNLENGALPHRTPADAFAAIFVANIFMRKWDQHLNNFAYAGDTPVAIDHDIIGPPSTFPHSLSGFSTFSLAFLSFKLITAHSHLRPSHAVDEKARERLKYFFVRQNDREAWGVMRDLVFGLGLGAGIIRAEGLQASSLRRSVIAFKTAGPIDLLAEEAGFAGRELENIAKYLSESQKRLGQDVNFVWRCLSGENARLDDLD